MSYLLAVHFNLEREGVHARIVGLSKVAIRICTSMSAMRHQNGQLRC